MSISRREFVELLVTTSAALGAAGCAGTQSRVKGLENLYTAPKKGKDLRLLHMTDVHGQTSPIYFREPNINIGLHDAKGRAPHLVGNNLLKHFGIQDEALAHAYTYLNFESASRKFGKVGGLAHMKSLIDKLRQEVPADASLLLDGGDTWQGSGVAMWTQGRDMIELQNILGVDIMTGHWEFTYMPEVVAANLQKFKGEFLAQNIFYTDEALFDDYEPVDDDNRAFNPYTIKEIQGRRVAVVGQAFPYVPIANPGRFVEPYSFGIRKDEMQGLVDKIHKEDKPDLLVVLSHNGMDVDVKLAQVVDGIDIILGGHTHDGVPQPLEVKKANNKRSLVCNAGCSGKYLGCMDIGFEPDGNFTFDYILYPIFSDLLPANHKVVESIQEHRQDYASVLDEVLGTTKNTLYRRNNFNGTFDQLICDAMIAVNGAEISLSPGFRWGTSLLPGQNITMERLLDQTAISYPETYVNEMSGQMIKDILEDVGDNLFNPDPFYQQGGDMVRVGGLNYSFAPKAGFGKRVSDMELLDGTKIEPNKNYKVGGWATVGSISPGRPIWEVVADYIRANKEIDIAKPNLPKLIGVDGNPGFEPI